MDDSEPLHSDSALDVTADTTTMEASGETSATYVVRDDVTCSKRIIVKGEVILVICNGKTLTCKKGIEVAEGGHLRIHRQKGAPAGKLVCQTSGSSNSDKVAAISVNEGSKLTINGCYVTATCKTNDGAGIGGDNGKSAGEITINAGEVTATSQMNGAGIGGGKLGSGGTITINGGKVTATAKDEDGAGIGGGQEGASGAIAINSGTVTARGASHGAGIGGGDASACGDNDSITITGGTVDAKGGAYAAGIGAGGDSGYGTIKISGGTITAKGGTESAAIGSANKGNVDNIEISGGDVIAIGASAAAGIGGGDGASCNGNGGQYGNITISDGAKVQAFGGTDGAGIGTGNEACNSDDRHNTGHITIKSGANVTAVGGCDDVEIRDDRVAIWDDYDYGDTAEDPDYSSRIGSNGYGAGIGGGDDTPSGTIDILDAGTVVHAYGSKRAAGIGSGEDGGSNSRDEDVITIKGAEVIAVGGERAAGIGGGDEGNFKTITIADDANVTAVGGSFGAGIGTGDCSNTGDDESSNDPDYNQIYISGANTKVTAMGGEDAAGIGGGDESPRINKIEIKNIGKYVRGEGYVKAVGQTGGAGIGGGCNPVNINDWESENHYYNFENIDIERASIMALGTFGAGIGGGGRMAGKVHPSNHGVGGTINIKNSFVTAISGAGGAGIGGGIWGYVEHTNIEGGVTIAQGGAIWIDRKPVAGGQYVRYLQNQAEKDEATELPQWIMAALLAKPAEEPNYIADSSLIGMLIDGLCQLISAKINGLGQNAFQGAGIGGGFRAPGGEITITQGDADMDGNLDGGMVIAAAGMLPKSKGLSDRRAKAIGVGGHYAEKKGDDNYRWNINYASKPRQYKVEEDHITKVSMYQDCAVVTAKLTCERPDDSIEPVEGAAYMSNPDMKAGYDPSAWAKNGNGDDTYSTVMLNNLAIVTPLTETFEVTFDKGAEDATGEMGEHPITHQPTSPSMVWSNPRQETGVMAPVVPVLLPPCGYTRTGYVFTGWLDKNTGNIYPPADQETAMAIYALQTLEQGSNEWYAAFAKVQQNCPLLNSDTTLYAQWSADECTVHYMVPKSDSSHHVILDESGNPEYEEYDTSVALYGLQDHTLPANIINGLSVLNWIEGTEQGPSTTGNHYAKDAEFKVNKRDVWLYANVDDGDSGPTYYIYTCKKYDDDWSAKRYQNVRGGVEYTFPDGEMFGQDGEVLTEWKVKGADTTYAPGQKIVPNEDLTLVAAWRPLEYTVKLDANGGSAEEGVLADRTLKWDSGAGSHGYGYGPNPDTYTRLPDEVTREGYILDGWCTVQNPTEENPGTMYEPGERVSNLSYEDHSTVTLYAQWVEGQEDVEVESEHYITFVKDAQYGTDDDDNAYVRPFRPDHGPVTLDECQFETPNGIFLGWATEPDGQVVYTNGQQIPVPEGDLTLYAKWQDGKWAKFGQSVELKDSLDFVFNVKELTDDPENYSIEYGPTDGEMQVTRLSDPNLNKFTIANCAAKEICDTFDVIVTHYATPGDGDVIKEAQYSIKDYCKAVIAARDGNGNTTDQKAVDLCKATLDYGSRVQEELGYRKANLANDGNFFYDTAAIDVPALDSRVSGSCDGITGQTISLNATSKTQFVVLFLHDAGADKTDYEFTVDGEPYSVDKVVDRNSKFEVWIDGIAAKDLDEEHTVTVSKGGETYSYTASPVFCMYKAVKVGKGVDVYKAFYNYYLKAEDYFAAVANA